MGFQIVKEDIEAVVKCEPGAIERVLRLVQLQVKLIKHQFLYR